MWNQRAISEPIRRKIQTFIQSGAYRYDSDKNRLVPNWHINLDNPWLFFGRSVCGRNCYLWKKIMFDHFDLVPEFCRFRCVKIVAKPPRIVDLIRTFHFANALPFLVPRMIATPNGKAGLDRRNYTTNAYSAFWYVDGLQQGESLYKLLYDNMRKADMKRVADTLIIKKACTEMEVEKGPTDKDFWKSMSEEERLLEARIGDIFLIEPDDTGLQASWHINAKIDDWLDYARSKGDLSGDKYYGIDAFKSVTYHNKEKE